MGATSTSRPDDPDLTARADAPTRQLVATGASDRCATCGAPLASDQRYCVNCGERRGKPRFSVAEAAVPAAVQTTSTTVRETPRRHQVSSGITLILGVGALLLAMLVGVLIGHNNSNSNHVAASNPPVQVVTVGGGGAGSAATPASSGPSSGPTTISPAAKASSKHAPAKKVVVTKQVAAKATAAASRVLGGGQNLAPPTVTQGGSCSNGQAGCQNGQFTGNFFGGGQ